MDSIFAIKGKDFVLVAADAYSAYSIIRLTNEDDKIMKLDASKVLALAGPIADRHQFGEYIARNIHLSRIRSGTELSTHAAANFARSELAAYLRQNPFQVNLLLAGMDNDEPHLYWVDFLASMVEIPKAAHGYGSNFILGLLDRYYKENLTEEEALDICKKCVTELRERFVLSQARFTVKIVSKTGVRPVTVEA